MFGFLMRSVSNNWSIFYDGNKANRRFCVDWDGAERWFSSFKNNELYEYELKLPFRTSYNVIPMLEDGEIINNKFMEYVMKEDRIQSRMKSMVVEFMNRFDILQDADGRIGFKKKEKSKILEVDSLPDPGLMRMKEFIFGLYRFDDLKVRTGVDQNKQPTYVSHRIHSDFGYDDQIPYIYNGDEYRTPLYGVYAPQYRKMMFDGLIDFGGGRVMQKWQLRSNYLLGEQTYLAAPRESGKTLLAASIVSIFACKALVDPRKYSEGMLINIYGLTVQNNQQIVNKIINLNKQLGKNQIFKYSASEARIYFYDGDNQPSIIQFWSQGQDNPGLGSRPSLVIVDEASRIDEGVLTVLKGQLNIPKIYISTIKHDTKKNWFYNGLIQAEMRQSLYEETMDDLVVRLWKKYGLDRVRDVQELKSNYNLLVQLQSELFKYRPYAGIRYTLDDNEIRTEDEKQRIIEDCMQISLSYLLAEHYSQFNDEDRLFDYDGLITNEEPKTLDYVSIFLDQATQYDNPALSVIGVKGNDVYVLDSMILSKDEQEQTQQTQEMVNKYKRYKGNQLSVYFSADCSQAKREQRAYLEDRGLFLDMALYITGGGNEKVDSEGFHIVGKDLLIQVAQRFFQRKQLLFMNTLEGDTSIFEELDMFQAEENKTTKRVKFHAIKGKDDQVMALISNLYFVYNNNIKYSMAEQDKNGMGGYNIYADIDGEYEDSKLEKKQNDLMEDMVEQMFGKFGY